jgi:hypothetical protein
MSVVIVQIGQCGNQIGIYSLILKDLKPFQTFLKRLLIVVMLLLKVFQTLFLT